MKLIESLIGMQFVFQNTEVNRELLAQGELSDITFGKVYAVEGIDEDGELFFLDDAGEANFAGMDYTCNGDVEAVYN